MTRLSALIPGDLKLKFDEIAIDPKVIRIKVTTDSYESMDRLENELRTEPHFASVDVGRPGQAPARWQRDFQPQYSPPDAGRGFMSEIIERLRNVWDNLSAREQILVGTAGGILVISLLVFAVVMPFFSVVEGAQIRVQTAEQSLMAMVPAAT